MGVPRSSDSEKRLDEVSSLARAGLERWARYVRILPLVAVVEEHRRELRRLVDWYERVCCEEEFVELAPAQGEEVLSVLGLSRLRSATDPLAIAQAAVRIATELVDYRQQLVRYKRIVLEGEPTDHTLRQHALAQLEAASRSVSDFLHTPA